MKLTRERWCLVMIGALALAACEAQGGGTLQLGDSVVVPSDVPAAGDGDASAPGATDAVSGDATPDVPVVDVSPADGSMSDTPTADVPQVDGAPADACAPDCAEKECGDDGCGGVCGLCEEGTSCSSKFICVCIPACDGKACGDDGCGGVCGTCDDGLGCDDAGQCQCLPSCAGKECGDDGCGGECGACPGIAPYCYDNTCHIECQPQCEGKACGDDGCEGSCGACGGGEACSPEGACECVPNCAEGSCGDDGCGAACSLCPDGASCLDDVCVDCSCGDSQCGPGPCGDSCGECPDGLYCNDGACEEACIPQCDGLECGNDGCGGVCGSCAIGSICEGGSCLSQCDLACSGKQCGADTCGGVCGECGADEYCNDNGQCAPVSDCISVCAAVECGDDGCGGSCGDCDFGLNCVFGSCVEACFDPAGCDGKSCGEDACGASCGSCITGLPCGFGGLCNACAICGLSDADCVDLNVEDSGLLGWVLEGDARVVTELGATGPLEGDKMLLLSTGLGFTTQLGEATFANCLPEGEWHLSFEYKFYSEELTEYCGSQFQDGLLVDLHQGLDTSGASESLYTVAVNDVCAPTDGSCSNQCGSKYVGLEPSDVSFDQGGVYNTPWVKVSLPLADLITPGETFTLKFHATDIGDSIFDTAILLDDVHLSQCAPSCGDAVCGDDGCGGSCGECADGGVCDGGTCCAPQCDGQACGSDGCGDVCGICAIDETCKPQADGTTVCEQDPCAAAGLSCGFTALGVDCGTCGDGESCTNGACCAPACANKTCGDDGCAGSCGECVAPETCVEAGEGGTVCTEGLCGPLDCGTKWSDALGMVECSCADANAVCLDGQTCCSPECDGKACGPDGCGGACGACADGELCIEAQGACCSPSCGEAACGPDGCGGSCGLCEAGWACDTGTCVDTTCDLQECGLNAIGLSCGTCSGMDACVDGSCICQPQCGDAQCGADGCGGVCGDCGPEGLCLDGVCCTPLCDGMECGGDGCGGSCGECQDDDACTLDSCEGGLCGFTPTGDPGCCADDAGCDDDDLCTLDTCGAENTCTFSPKPGCCEADADCDDDNACSGDLCVDGLCTHEWSDAAGCCVGAPASYLFDSDEGFVFEGGAGACGWTLMDSDQATSGSSLLYYGDPAALNFDCGDQVGTATGPSFELSAGVGHELRFDLRMDTEGGNAYDILDVYALLANGELIQVWHKDDASLTEELELKTANLGGLAGQTIQLQFVFDTVDSAVNGAQGVFIDTVHVVSGCAPDVCAEDAQCDDLKICTEDLCVDGGCVSSVSPNCCQDALDCIDGDACTQDTCDNSLCSNAPIAGCCATVEDCDDGLLCTSDACVDGFCTNAPVAGCCEADEDCDDLNACTTDACPGPGEMCQNIVVEGCCTLSAECDDDDSCTTDLCIGNACTHQNSCCVEDADCDDDDACSTDTCVDGTCGFEWSPDQGCCNPAPATYDFEGDEGFLFQGGNAPCGWSTLESPLATTGSSLLYYGNPVLMNFDCGDQTAVATGPSFFLAHSVGHELRFDLRMDTEMGDTYDVLDIYAVLNDGTRVLVWHKDVSSATATLEPKTASLSGLAGQWISLELEFDTGDGAVNSAQGVFVDHLRVVSGCGSMNCEADSDCDDLQVCTDDSCVDGLCTSVENPGCCDADLDCFDGDTCTSDSCVDNACSNADIEGCCVALEDCADGNPCTEDSCSDNTCSNAWAPGCCAVDADCNDDDVCTLDSCPEPGGVCNFGAIEMCCVSAPDCDDGSPCTLDSCVANSCQWVDNCCEVDEDCDNLDSCSDDTCVDGLCEHAWSTTPDCCSPEPAAWTFEEPLSLDVTASTPPCGWSIIATDQAQSGMHALYYGNPETQSYDCGTNGGTATVPLLSLTTPGVEYELNFKLAMYTESGGTYDKLFVYASLETGEELLLWDKASLPGINQWHEAVVSLSGLAGSPFQLRFEFETGDSVLNSTAGVFIDDIVITSTCAPKPCETAEACDDMFGWSIDTCEEGVCAYALQ